MSIVNLLKKLPIDVGQAGMKEKTEGKQIAFSFIPIATELVNEALDIGCRDGYWSKQLQSKNYRVTSVDIEPRYENASQLDADKPLPYDDGKFDIVWCSEVIEHLKDPALAIQEMQRVTKTGGRILLTTPNSYFLLMRLVYLLLRTTPQKTQNPGHLHFFDIKSFHRVLPEHGCQVYGFFPYAILKFRIRRLLGSLTPTFVVVIDV
jgi:SAM-dependent methyltransferase